MSNMKFIFNGLFALGGGITGFLLGYKMSERKKETEINSVKEAFRKEKNRLKSKQEPTESMEENKDNAVHVGPAKTNAEQIRSEKLNYTRAVKNLEYSPTAVKTPQKDIFVIDESEVGTVDDYEEIELLRLSDGTIVDGEDYDIMKDEDIVSHIGDDSLVKFRDVTCDVVYVRNTRLKIDYTILRDSRKYEDILSECPYLI